MSRKEVLRLIFSFVILTSVELGTSYKEIFESQSKLIIGAAVGVGVIAASGIAIWYQSKQVNAFPTKWRRVGEISDLICYPIKSCGPIRINTFKCTHLGVEDNLLRDRTFMVITSNDGQFTTGRQYPKLVQIIPRFDGDDMILSAPGMIDIKVNVKRLFSIEPIKAVVWGEAVDAVDCGEEVAKWISRFIVSEDFGMRLVFYPNAHPTRDVREKNRSFITMNSSDSGALHDATSYMLINESSITELNSRLENAVTPLRFRGNFVVKGPEAWEEDNWKWIKIGSSVVFRNVKPCTRCIFTNVNPETAERDPNGETLNALKEYRLFPEIGVSPVCGIHMGMRFPGKVSLGDAVYVSDGDL